MMKVVLALLLIINCIVDLTVRINDASDPGSSLYASELFGPICLLISFCLALVMAIVDKVCFSLEIKKLWGVML